MTDWQKLRELIEGNDPEAVKAAVLDLDPDQRRALAKPLTDYERELRREGRRWLKGPALSIAGAAVLSAATLGPWLSRDSVASVPRRPEAYRSPHERTPEEWREFHRAPSIADHVLEVLRARDVPWLPDLAFRLAERMRPRNPVYSQNGHDMAWLVTELAGDELPTSDGYVFHAAVWWLRRGTKGIARAVREDPRMLPLIPRLFEVDNAARQFGESWPDALGELADEGVVDRALLLDGCLARLQRGGTQSALAGLARLHARLAPNLDEVAPRAADYAALVPDSPSPIATVALEQLRALDDEGRLDPDIVVDVSRAVFVRREKKLIRAQLSWLDKVVERAPDAVAAVAPAFGHDAHDVQERAVKLVLKHGVTASARDELSSAATALAPDLRERLAGVLGAVDAEPEPLFELSAAPRAAMPPPLASADEVASVQAGLLRNFWEQVDVVEVERVLAGLVEFAWSDRDALRAAFANSRIEPGLPTWDAERRWHSPSELGEIVAIVGGVLDECRGGLADPVPELPGDREWRSLLTEHVNRLTLWMERLHEISLGVVHAPRPFLLATPTETGGLIAPEVLADRLEEAARQGFSPWPFDFTQALLRLPRTADPATVDRMRGLGDAGARAAEWIDQGGLGELRTKRVVSQVRVYSYRPNPTYQDRTRVEVEYPDSPVRLGNIAIDHEYWRGCWPSVLPAHRDVIAAELVPALEGDGKRMGPLLPLLAEGYGPIGDGMNTALALGLGMAEADDRAHAVDALITLAGRGEFDGPGLGEAVGHLVSRDELVLSRVVAALGDAARSGVPVWSAVSAALSALLPHDGERPRSGLADLIALGVDTCEVGEPVPGLAEVAGRKGSSRFVKEARRLHARLAG
ncbi:DUF6493 family protein [Saccharopolyspora taberi]|uniref:DUF6493 family protein n=1 Tax=Saccharopolyspora taberi TaxID=60895 RepID=A0ABN3VJD4_9PSEU